MRISYWSSDVCSSDLEHLDDLDLNPILAKVDAPDDQRRFSLTKWRNPVPDSLDAQMMKDARAVFERGEKMQLTYTVRNTHRAVGTRLSARSEEHPSELQSLMRISYAVFCLKNKQKNRTIT